MARIGAGVVAERLVELIVVVLRFAKTVNNVTQMEQEGRPVRLVGGLAIQGHPVADPDLVLVGAGVGRAGIAERVEDDLAGLGDGLFNLCPMRPIGIAQPEQTVGGRARRVEADNVFFQQGLELGVLRVVRWMTGGETCGVGRGGAFTKGRLVKHRVQ